jgi:tetratricopeptide (TPR) repeat protein
VSRTRATAILATLCLALGCGTLGGGAARIEDAADRGDPQRRASMRLLLDGLDSDESGSPRRALSRYERAMQIDAGNPYVHLALARHYIANDSPDQALSYLDQAQVLFESEVEPSPGVEAHLMGLRGIALRELGRTRQGDALLREAAQRAPSVWGDGWLDADELR